MLKESIESLSATYDLAMLDLDGVVYIGSEAVTGAPQHLERARAEGMHLAFVTNNAARTPAQVARHLTDLGLRAGAEDVVTSAQAAAHVLAGMLDPGAHVFTLGAEGLREALVDEGLVPVLGLEDEPVAVVSGYDPELPWRRLMQGAMLIRDGFPWVASNTDGSVPMAWGLGPGHGVQVRMLSDYAGVEPVVAGKPQRPLLDETVRRVSGERPLMVGDRLDTDIEGANGVGIDSLLVLTGVTELQALVCAGPRSRPTYIATDLGGLFEAQPVARPLRQSGSHPENGGASLGGWQARATAGRLTVDGFGVPNDWWRLVATVAWGHLDETGDPIDVTGCEVPSGSTAGGTVRP